MMKNNLNGTKLVSNFIPFKVDGSNRNENKGWQFFYK